MSLTAIGTKPDTRDGHVRTALLSSSDKLRMVMNATMVLGNHVGCLVDGRVSLESR